MLGLEGGAYRPTTLDETVRIAQVHRLADEISRTKSFLRRNDLQDSPEALEAFYGLLRLAERIGDRGTGLAGYLTISSGTGEEMVMALALNPRFRFQFAIRHELHHFAREAIFRTQFGRSLFLEEITGTGMQKFKLFITEEMVFGIRAFLTF